MQQKDNHVRKEGSDSPKKIRSITMTCFRRHINKNSKKTEVELNLALPVLSSTSGWSTKGPLQTTHNIFSKRIKDFLVH
jgi:hypothetical protein